MLLTGIVHELWSLIHQDLNMKWRSIQRRLNLTEAACLRRSEGSQLIFNLSLRTANLGYVASLVARSQPTQLQHLERIAGRGSGIIPSKFGVSWHTWRPERRWTLHASARPPSLTVPVWKPSSQLTVAVQRVREMCNCATSFIRLWKCRKGQNFLRTCIPYIHRLLYTVIYAYSIE